MSELARRIERVGRARKSVKAPASPSRLDRLERTVLSYQQGMDPRVVRGLLQRMARR